MHTWQSIPEEENIEWSMHIYVLMDHYRQIYFVKILCYEEGE